MDKQYCEDSIMQTLKDAGCDETISKGCIQDLQRGKQVLANTKLQMHRQKLLDELHKVQKEIDCLDYLIFMLKKHKNYVQIRRNSNE